MTPDENKCEPPEELRGEDGCHLLENDGVQSCLMWRAHPGGWDINDGYLFPEDMPPIWRYVARITTPAEVESLRTENARLRDVLVDARLQLEYLDSRWPTGTTPTILARINTVMESK